MLFYAAALQTLNYDWDTLEKGGKSFFCYLPLTPVPLRFALSLLF